MSNINDVTQALCAELVNYGAAELTSSVSIFTGKPSETPGIKGDIRGEKFRVIMFDSEESDGISAASAHITLNVNRHKLSNEHIDYWNSDNRFTKIYKHEDDTYLVMDALISTKSTEIIRSVAKIWDISLRDISKVKSSYERKSRFR